MLRWLTRLLVFGIIVAVVGFAISRLLNREEDFEDFDDIEAGLDFQETPVEIEVAAETTSAPPNTMSQAEGTGMATLAESAGPTDQSGASLTDITGIGPAYEARLNSIGINTIDDLARADAAHLAEQIEVIGGQSTIEHWIDQARQHMAQSTQSGADGQS